MWPSLVDGTVTISSAQLSYLLAGIYWRMPQETWRPTAVIGEQLAEETQKGAPPATTGRSAARTRQRRCSTPRAIAAASIPSSI
jgi:hypothetical protein